MDFDEWIENDTKMNIEAYKTIHSVECREKKRIWNASRKQAFLEAAQLADSLTIQEIGKPERLAPGYWIAERFRQMAEGE